MELDTEELKATKNRKSKCEYCKKDEYVFEHNFIQDNKHKQIVYFPTSSWEGITKLYIEYCPMCR